MKILLVEDAEANRIAKALESNLPDVKVSSITTEWAFRARFDEIANNPPDIIIMDLLLPWAAPGQKVEKRVDELQEDITYFGGLRCARMLAQDQRTSAIQIILYSALERDDTIDDFLRNLPGRPVNWRPAYLHKQGRKIDSLIQLIRSLSFVVDPLSATAQSVFIVHGHDDAKEAVGRLIEKLGFRAIILQEQPNKGRPIIEKFEDHSDVAFAVVILTPDDIGASQKERNNLKPRARQNVVFELGFFVAKIGRENVCALVKDDIEFPSDYDAVSYIRMESNGAWRNELAREMKASGLPVDMNKVV
jgi:CheY-like chemotaxis protein